MPRRAKDNEESETTSQQSDHLIRLAADVVSSYLRNNQVAVAEIPNMIGAIHTAIIQSASGVTAGASQGEAKPAVPIKKSVGDDFIICLEDGKKLTMLKRYLKTHYNLTPDEYRRKWDLPHDYPMVAPAYARLRSSFAKKIGLGRIATQGRGRRKAKTA